MPTQQAACAASAWLVATIRASTNPRSAQGNALSRFSLLSASASASTIHSPFVTVLTNRGIVLSSQPRFRSG